MLSDNVSRKSREQTELENKEIKRTIQYALITKMISRSVPKKKQVETLDKFIYGVDENDVKSMFELHDVLLNKLALEGYPPKLTEREIYHYDDDDISMHLGNDDHDYYDSEEEDEEEEVIIGEGEEEKRERRRRERFIDEDLEIQEKEDEELAMALSQIEIKNDEKISKKDIKAYDEALDDLDKVIKRFSKTEDHRKENIQKIEKKREKRKKLEKEMEEDAFKALDLEEKMGSLYQEAKNNGEERHFDFEKIPISYMDSRLLNKDEREDMKSLWYRNKMLVGVKFNNEMANNIMDEELKRIFGEINSKTFYDIEAVLENLNYFKKMMESKEKFKEIRLSKKDNSWESCLMGIICEDVLKKLHRKDGYSISMLCNFYVDKECIKVCQELRLKLANEHHPILNYEELSILIGSMNKHKNGKLNTNTSLLSIDSYQRFPISWVDLYKSNDHDFSQFLLNLEEKIIKSKKIDLTEKCLLYKILEYVIENRRAVNPFPRRAKRVMEQRGRPTFLYDISILSRKNLIFTLKVLCLFLFMVSVAGVKIDDEVGSRVTLDYSPYELSCTTLECTSYCQDRIINDLDSYDCDYNGCKCTVLNHTTDWLVSKNPEWKSLGLSKMEEIPEIEDKKTFSMRSNFKPKNNTYTFTAKNCTFNVIFSEDDQQIKILNAQECIYEFWLFILNDQLLNGISDDQMKTLFINKTNLYISGSMRLAIRSDNYFKMFEHRFDGRKLCKVSDCIFCWRSFESRDCNPKIHNFILYSILIMSLLVIGILLFIISPLMFSFLSFLWKLAVLIVNGANALRVKISSFIEKKKANSSANTLDINISVDDTETDTSTDSDDPKYERRKQKMRTETGGRFWSTYSRGPRTKRDRRSHTRGSKTKSKVLQKIPLTVVVIMIALPLILACDSNSLTISTNVIECTTHNGTHENCVAKIEDVQLHFDVGVTCINIIDDKKRAIAHLEINLIQTEIMRDFTLDYITARWTLVSDSHARCPGTHNCPLSGSKRFDITNHKCQTCCDDENKDAWGELHNTTVVNLPGITRCYSGCDNGFSCGCLVGEPMCIFSRYALDIDHDESHVMKEINSDKINVVSQIKLSSHGKIKHLTRVNENLGGHFHDDENLLHIKIKPLEHVNVNIMNGRDRIIFKKDHPVSIAPCADYLSPEKYICGDVQWKMNKNAAIWDHSMITEIPHSKSVSYSHPNPGVISSTFILFENPMQYEGHGLRYEHDKFLYEKPITVVTEVYTEHKNFTFRRRITGTCPEGKILSIEGCFECKSGAILKLQLHSTCGSGSVFVESGSVAFTKSVINLGDDLAIFILPFFTSLKEINTNVTIHGTENLILSMKTSLNPPVDEQIDEEVEFVPEEDAESENYFVDLLKNGWNFGSGWLKGILFYGLVGIIAISTMIVLVILGYAAIKVMIIVKAKVRLSELKILKRE
jgi:hypothetical protein